MQSNPKSHTREHKLRRKPRPVKLSDVLFFILGASVTERRTIFISLRQVSRLFGGRKEVSRG